MPDRRELARPSRSGSPLTSAAGIAAAAAATAAGGWILYSAVGIDHALPLPEAIAAERRTITDSTGRALSYYVDTQASGRPLVLAHSINAAASAYEMRPLFEYYRGKRPVYALDLPGFGFSERSPRRYTPQVFEEAILDLLTTIVDEPADLIALSLSSEFAAWAALAQPSRLHSLALISPTGLRAGGGSGGSDASHEALHAALTVPLWSSALFDLVATRRSIEWFLSRSYLGPVPREHVDYCYASAHQPHAEHAPLAFISGLLFTPDVREYVYQALRVPTLVLYDQDPYTSFEELPGLLERNDYWKALRIAPSRGLPQMEQLYQTAEALDGFWQGIAAG